MAQEEVNVFDLPEDTITEMIDKVDALALDIRSDWTDPRFQCKEISGLCHKLRSSFHDVK